MTVDERMHLGRLGLALGNAAAYIDDVCLSKVIN